MEENSGVSWGQAEVALARQWLGPNEGKYALQTVKLKSVEPTQGNVEDLGTTVPPSANAPKPGDGEKIEEVQVPGTMQQAADIIKQFESGAQRTDEMVADTISQHVQNDQTALKDEQWWGTEEEERNWYAITLWFALRR